MESKTTMATILVALLLIVPVALVGNKASSPNMEAGSQVTAPTPPDFGDQQWPLNELEEGEMVNNRGGTTHRDWPTNDFVNNGGTTHRDWPTNDLANNRGGTTHRDWPTNDLV